MQWRAIAPAGAWYAEIGEVLVEHYLELNASLPDIAGPAPRMRAVG